MEVNQEHINTLLNMGFHYEGVKRALRLAKNDLNEAVAILTEDHPTSGYDTLYDVGGLDVEMREPYSCTSQGTTAIMYGPALPPTYDEAVEGGSSARVCSPDQKTANQETAEKDQSFEFPVANLYELENRVFTEQWSIPYKKEESLGRCLLAATKLAEEGLLEADPNCVRFIEKCLPEAFSKLLTSPAVHRWGSDIQEGICDMLQLLIDLIATRLAKEPLPTDLLHVLAMVFNMETEFNSKNKGRMSERMTYWEELFGLGKVYAVCTSPYKDPYGWLTDLINQFAEKKGFDYVKERLEMPELDAPSMAALFEPFGNCAELLNCAVVKPLLSNGFESALKYAEGLQEIGFKEKKVGSVYDMLSSMKLLSLDLWPQLVSAIDDLKINITLKMLKSPHFNARMNALKEVSKMIEDSTRTRSSRSAISQDKILDWLVEERVLSIALEGNIDQVQYCDKIKYIIEFLGAKLSAEELTKIWKMQNGEATVVIDNIHSIVAAAAVKFNPSQLENLVLLIKKSWKEENDVMREKLLRLIGWIGRESKNSKITHKVLELLWDLAHLPTLKTLLIEQALDEHLTILSDSFAVKEPIKRQYIVKCVEDIREGKWVLPALRQILQITKSIAKHSYNKAEKATIQDLHKNYEIIKQVTSSLMKFHQLAMQIAKDGQLSRMTIVDGRYTHYDYVSVHLNFLQFLLQEGGLYLPWHRARDIWDTLAANPQACEWDREMCYEWFSKGIADLEQDTQAQLFQKELLKLDPSKLTRNGFQCFKCFFENVNQHENKLKKTGNTLTIEKTDLMGLDFLWKICLNTPDADIAEMATSLLLNVSYLGLAPRFKRDPSNFHQKFINECNSWLELAMIPLEGSAIAATLLEATKILAATGMPSGSCLPSPSRSNNLLNIERLLLIAERYIVSVEELHAAARSILPHGASFQGQPLQLNVHCDAHKTEFLIQAHTNESVGSVRQKIAKKMKLPVEQIQFVPNEKVPNRDQKLLNQLCLEDNQVLNIRIASSTTISSYPSSQDLGGISARQSLDLEEEKMLPGVIMSNGGQVFEMLYHLASLDQPRITNRARSLLKLIPTNPAVVELLDSISHRSYRSSVTAEKEPSPKLTPQNSPRRQPGSSGNLGAPQPGLVVKGGSTTSSSSQGGLASLKGSSSSASLTSIAANAKSTPPRDILKGMLTSASGITMFQVLYNLEVLSSRLMPTQKDVTTSQSARKFCDDFLDAGGLSLLISILQKETISPEVDYETRQGCYAVSLQLLRFLFCGQDVTGEAHSVSAGRRSSGGSTAASAMSSGSGSGPSSLESMGIACRAIQSMDVNEFTEMVGCFMRVTWAAAAGKLQLVGSMQPIKDVLSLNAHSSRDFCGRQSVGSNGSGTSSGSESDLSCLHAGICIKQKLVSSKDTYIAIEALELLVACLQLRSSLLAVFYTLPCVGDFMVDVLVGSPQQDVRSKAVEQFNLLSKTDFSPTESTGHQQTPHQFILQTLLKARLPFWVSSSKTRGASYRLLQQCKQYFELKCLLLAHLSVDDQNRLMVDARRMLEDEVTWLVNFVPSENGGDIRLTDNTLLAGHLHLIQTLLTCEHVDKVDAGKHLIHDLLCDFLFPASKIIVDATNSGNADLAAANYMARCSESESRVAAYEVLVELAHGNLENTRLISSELVHMHHRPNLEMATQWEFMPPVDSRTSAGFVGLKNGGATCYMNSLLQQLYMTPGIAEFLLAIDDEEVDEESVLFQVQQVMGHLLESKLQYYEPERFWRVFRLWGKTINVREQQDALDFFQALIDQLDEQIIKLGKDPIFKKNFQGFFSDQKICKDCQHRYEQEELFFALNVTVKNATLQESLDQFVKGELLEGENAYFCEKCGVKRNTIKRMCIKTLPPVLCIQLKRFDYDWEANRAIKFDDFFRFPFVLDMEPYTAEGMAWREQLSQSSHDTDSGSQTFAAGDAMSDDSSITDFSTSVSSSTAKLSETSGQLDVPKSSASSLYITAPVNASRIDYELVGVVVHSGQANAGHYYSFIKDRRGNYMTNPNKGKWYRFNDTVVEEFEMTDANLEAECFGGKYKAKVYDSIASSNSHPEERLRYWNGYLLFYERVEDVRTPISAKKSKMSMFRIPSEKSGFGQRQDSLKQLTELVHKGEKKGIFSSRMPARIQQVVREENLHFMKNRNVYDADYFLFIRKLASVNINISNVQFPDYTQMCLASLELSVHFLFNTYFRTKTRLRMEPDEWSDLITALLQSSKESCIWIVEFLALEGSSCIKPLILECPTKEIRMTFGKILEKTMSSFFYHGGVPTQKCFDDIIELMLGLLNRDVVEHHKNCFQYFQVLSSYTQMGIKACSHMFGRNAFKRLMEFLIGPVFLSSEQEVGYRRWSSVQAREFGPLHSTLAGLILCCDLSQFRTMDPAQPQHQPYKPAKVSSQKLLKMPLEMQRFVFASDSAKYLREVVLALREVTTETLSIHEMLLYCSSCNSRFSLDILKSLMVQCLNSPSNELKSLFVVLHKLLLLDDQYQLERLKFVIDGGSESQVIGMLSAISQCHTSDSRRSYQVIKFLVGLATKCPMAKEYLLQAVTKWQWAVNWLQSKMSEHLYWNPHTDASNEDPANTQSFQRTISAQDTLAEATALLTEFSAHEQDMEVGKQGGDKAEEVAEASRSSSPVFFTTHSPAEHVEDFDTVDQDIS